MSEKIKIALVDDHPVLLAGIAAIFADDDDFEVVAKGTCADDAVSISATHRPDVVVLDLNMPGDAFAAMTDIGRMWPRTRIVAFTAACEIDTAVKTLRSGACGYLVKGSEPEELRDGNLSVMQGETFVTPNLRQARFSMLLQLRSRVLTQHGLSCRETQIVRLLYKGKTNKEIATHLKISEKTVKHYMTILMQKLNVQNELEVVMASQRMVQIFNSTAFAPSRPS